MERMMLAWLLNVYDLLSQLLVTTKIETANGIVTGTGTGSARQQHTGEFAVAMTTEMLIEIVTGQGTERLRVKESLV
jgi:hypothetical protein